MQDLGSSSAVQGVAQSGIVERELAPSVTLTSDAEINFGKIRDELALRSAHGLATTARLSPRDQIEDRLSFLARGYPEVSRYLGDLSRDLRASDFDRPLIVGIPVAGFGAQEYGRLARLAGELSKDSAVQAGRVQVLVFANRPPGTEADTTGRFLREAAARANLPLAVIEGEVPANLGRTDGPLMEAHQGNGKNRVPIAFIRDVLSLSAMELWSRNPNTEQAPVYLQMDVDFEGFASGGFQGIIDRFASAPQLSFLQATSRFDDQNFPTAGVPLLRLGDDLMRELPLLLKRALSTADLPDASRIQIVCGEAIQRGVQVPQAERLECIARKGGYGLLRMPEDELDANIRLSAIANEFAGIACCDRTIFNWNSRRAILAFGSHSKPPISQWAVEFCAVDVARDENRVRSVYEGLVSKRACPSAQTVALDVVNQTLARFPIPQQIPGVYLAAELAVGQALRNCGVEASAFTTRRNENGTFILQAKSITAQETLWS